MAKKRKIPTTRPKVGRVGIWASLLAVVLAVGGSNWFVHEPRAFRERAAEMLSPALIQTIEQLGNMTAQQTDDWGLTGHDMVAAFNELPPFERDVFGGYPVRIPGGKAPGDAVLLHKKGFTAAYSPSLKHPVWSVYRIDPTHKKSSPPRDGIPFSPDKAVKSPATHAYTGSGYDRGHMAPNYAIASRMGRPAQTETFLTSNISPQMPDLNRGPWQDVEHRLAQPLSDAYGPIWVIVGAHSVPNGKRLKSGIDVPVGFYQIAVTVDGDQLKGFALYMPQETPRKAISRGYFISIRALEEMTGWNFFPELPAEMQDLFEIQESSRFWPTALRATRGLDALKDKK